EARGRARRVAGVQGDVTEVVQDHGHAQDVAGTPGELQTLLVERRRSLVVAAPPEHLGDVVQGTCGEGQVAQPAADGQGLLVQAAYGLRIVDRDDVGQPG